jgi:hypothetical protein
MADTLDDSPDDEQLEAVPARLGEELDATVVAEYLRPPLPRTDGDLEIVQFQSKDERLSTYDRRMQACAEVAQDVMQHAHL